MSEPWPVSQAWPRYLARFLIVLNASVLILWLPEYLSWPWWTDHDVFATMARGWDAGLLPYRDLKGTNFPGTMYLFWLLGRTVGWGNTASFYVLDVVLLLGFIAALLVWSRRCLGHLLPGLVGCSALLPYYLGLDFSLTAQRDWQAPLLAFTGLLLQQSFPGRAARVLSAVLFACGVTIRPQIVLFIPAAVLAMGTASEAGGNTIRWRPLLEWTAVFAVSLVLAFSPLWLAGVFGDFLEGVRRVSYGSHYNKVRPSEFLARLIYQIAFNNKLVVLILTLGLYRLVPDARRVTAVWNLAFILALLYFPLSPKAFPYGLHPLWIAWAINVAVLTHQVMHVRADAPVLQAALVLVLALGLSPTLKPGNANISRFWAFVSGRPAAARGVPLGYKHPYEWPLYSWPDYQSVLHYLRTRTSPATRIANLARVAITAPADRRPVFPAESTSWLIMIDAGDEDRFATSLAGATDSVVVWAPEAPYERDEFPRLKAAVRRFYAPEARFGQLEIWRRKASSPDPPGYGGTQ